jgi:hypothetical protein
MASFAGREILESKNTTNTMAPVKVFLSKYFYLAMSLIFAGLVVWGFSRTVDASLLHASPPRPLLLWFHGAAFSTWVVFFIAQSALVRVRKVSVHRLLGWFGAGLAVAMVVLGLAITPIMARFDTVVLHQTGADAFMSVPFYDMIAFGALIALAIYWRKKPDYHRRLVFIASCGLMDAAVGRFAFIFDNSLFFPVLDCLILLGVGRDLVVDGRVNKVYRYALPVLLVGQGTAVYLWRGNPLWWQGVTRTIVG